jgi:hypothetical protein
MKAGPDCPYSRAVELVRISQTKCPVCLAYR